MTQEEMEFVDNITAYRINRQEREKEKQKARHQKKIESKDWFGILNKKGETDERESDI